MKDLIPQRPQHLSPLAERCLHALSESGYANRVSIGGAVGLMHYYEYRPTHDIDAWWLPATKQEEREEVIALLESTLQPYGEVRTRRWGDVVSVDLRQDSRTVFSFQVAGRSVQLSPLQQLPWSSILLDSFTDLIASKMVALVERGTPRDFRDIYVLCQANLTNAVECWQLWRQRQIAAGNDNDMQRAMLAVQLHLERIEKHRPLTLITDDDERQSAGLLRSWFREELMRVKGQ